MKRTYILCLLLLLLTVRGVHGEEAQIVPEIAVDYENQRITVSAQITPVNAGLVTTMLLRPEYAQLLPEQLAPENISAAAEHFLAVEVDENGAVGPVELAMRSDSPSGWYRLIFGAAGTDAVQEERIFPVYYPSKEEFEAALGKLNAAASPAQLQQVMREICEPNPILGFSLEEIYRKYEAEVCQMLMERKTQAGGSYASASEFRGDLEEVMAHFERIEEALRAIHSANRDTLTQVLQTYHDVIGVELSGDYADNPTAVNKKLIGRNFSTIEEFCAAFDAALEKESTGSGGSGGSGGGSSGGGTGGGRSSVTSSEGAPLLPGIQPSEQQAEEEPVAFTDLGTAEWARESIDTLSARGIVSGDGTGKFLPDQEVTRAEFVKMLLLALGIEVEAGDSFSDVEEGAWYGPYLATAKRAGIAMGREDGTFGALETITREDMAVMTVRAADYANVAFYSIREVSFTDESQIEPYCADAVNLLAKAGILSGMPDGTFAPKSNLTRAQSAKIVCGILNVAEKR